MLIWQDQTAPMRTFLTTAGFILAISIIYSAADAQTVTVSADTCAALTEHVAGADVAYAPGVGARGEAVTPADLGGGLAVDLPAEFSIPINVDLRRRLGVPDDPSQYQTRNFQVGTVTVRDGRAYFNGQPLQDEDAAALSRLCQQARTPR
jgi:hypothetical protein